jgi:hypothetical protein
VSKVDEIVIPIVKGMGAEWTSCIGGSVTTRLYLCFEWNGGMRGGHVYLFCEEMGAERTSLYLYWKRIVCNPKNQIVSLM